MSAFAAARALGRREARKSQELGFDVVACPKCEGRAEINLGPGYGHSPQVDRYAPCPNSHCHEGFVPACDRCKTQPADLDVPEPPDDAWRCDDCRKSNP